MTENNSQPSASDAEPTDATAASELPMGVALTPFDEAYQQDPYAVLKQAQATNRSYFDSEFRRVFVTDHAAVKKVLRDRDMWSDPRKASQDSFSAMFRPDQRDDQREPSMLFLDDPQHKRLRNLVNKAFTPAAVEKLRPRIREIAQELVSGIESDPFDIVAHVAAPLPAIVIAEMLGIEEANIANFKAWSDTSTATFFNPFRSEDDLAAGAEAGAKLDALFREQIRLRRDNPGTDLTSAMVLAREGDDTLSDDEIVSQCNLLLVAGNVTTTDLIGNGLKALMENPAQLELLRSKPELMANAVEEMLRFDSPVTQSGRIADKAMEVAGCPIHQGGSISVSLAAANRDPLVFEDPDTFNIEREDTSHQSFGGGRHFCLGAPLARVEAQEAIAAILARFGALSMHSFDYRTTPGFRGLNELWLAAQ